MKRIIICLLCVVLLCGCVGVNGRQNDEKITVVTTIFPLYDFARHICGDKAEVKMLIKPGSEVHSFDPLPSDMRAVYDSDLFLYIGGESDKWVYNLIDDTEINSLALIGTVEHIHKEHYSHNHTDEHIWTSPQNAELMLEAICNSITQVDSKNADIYQQNCDAYKAQINMVSNEIREIVSQCKNPFVLVADRFPFVFFTAQYGIEYEAAFDGCAVSTDISLKTMSRLTQTIKARNIKTVFCTELSSKNIANALRQELGVEIAELHSAHNVTLDDFNSGVSYVDIMYRNKTALEKGLK